MKRRNEVPFIIGLCMVSMLAFSSSLFLEGAQGAAFKQRLGSQWHSVTQAADGLFRGFGRTTPTRVTPATAQVANSKATPADGTHHSTVSNAPAQQLTQADINRLAKIANELLSTTTQQEWTEAATAIAKDKPDVAEATLASLFASHIKPADLVWLNKHFTGSAAFGLKDVTMLQQTLAQVMAELTPQEQQLIKQGLAKYAGTQKLPQASG